MCNATFSHGNLYLIGDLNTSTHLEILGGMPDNSTLSFNGRLLPNTQGRSGRLQAELPFEQPSLSLPDFSAAQWRFIDSLPELANTYDDAAWSQASAPKSNNPRNLTTPTSLYCSDYGYNGGSLIYRGHFVASGNESLFNLTTSGGEAYGHSLWLNDTFLGSFAGDPHLANSTQLFDLPALAANENYVFTVVIDHMGNSMNFWVRSEWMKLPRGTIDYKLDDHTQSDVAWKLTGNMGGESYVDKTRGPLNEGAFFAERQDFHLPGAPSSNWTSSSPSEGIQHAGIAVLYDRFRRGYATGL